MIPTSSRSQNFGGTKNKKICCYLVNLLVMMIFNAKQALSSLLQMFINELHLDEISLQKAIGS
jgi:hypothetical protein